MSGPRLTRRDFLARTTAAGSLAGAGLSLAWVSAAAPATNVVAPRIRKARSVVSFHLDQPYLDPTGEAIPYLPPAGLRGADALARLSAEDLFRLPL
ncbi:MAG: twin-arginine translocation signal domain-containing protein [Gammaproteobacteria bacterium]